MPKSSLLPSLYSDDFAEKILSGGDEFERGIVNTYVYNLISNTRQTSAFAYKICSVIEEYMFLFFSYEERRGVKTESFPFKKPEKDSVSYPTKAKPNDNSVDNRDWEFLTGQFKTKIEATPVSTSSTEKNISLVADLLSLGKIEKEILTFLYLASSDYSFSEFSKQLTKKNNGAAAAFMSRALNRPTELDKIAKILDENSPLFSSGILYRQDQSEYDPDEKTIFPLIDERLMSLIASPALDRDYLIEMLFGKPCVSDLSIEDFDLYKDDIATICTIIENAIERGEAGINILLHGPAGSGKTEMAKAIAAHLNKRLFAIGESEEDSKEVKDSAQYRKSKLLQANSFLRDSKDVILMFDEIEDLLIKGTDSSKKADTPSKVIFNRLLEVNPVVTLWGGNDPDKFHESMRQRFSYSLYVDYPPTKIRKKIWERQQILKGIKLPEKDQIFLARQYQAPPRMIANALRLASLTEPTISNIEKFLHASSKIAYGDTNAIRSGASISDKFSIDLINYDPSKDNKVKSIIASGAFPRPYSLFMTGKAGAGIKSLSRYLAELAVMNTAEFDMRDLLAENPLMPPAAKIKQAFQAANDAKNLLVISDVDALSAEPGNSDSWKQNPLSDLFMECVYAHNLPMIASTFKPEIEIPDFIKEGFSLDLALSSLTPDQCSQAFEIYFGRKGNEKPFPEDLLPGDFAKVAKIVRKGLNGETPDAEILERLSAQVRQREVRSNLGFHTIRA